MVLPNYFRINDFELSMGKETCKGTITSNLDIEVKGNFDIDEVREELYNGCVCRVCEGLYEYLFSTLYGVHRAKELNFERVDLWATRDEVYTLEDELRIAHLLIDRGIITSEELEKRVMETLLENI